jgi:hypothetical protein
MSLWHVDPWQPTLNWDNSSGRLLLRTMQVLDQGQPLTLDLFGSAPLQMGVDANLVSADLDLLDDSEQTHELLSAQRMLKGQASPYVEPCDETSFTAAAGWRKRAYQYEHGHVTVVFPHPIDILVSKVKRMAEKDYHAFEAVRAVTGHPTEPELIASLQRMVDLYRPSFDEEAAQDPFANTRLLWQRFFGHDIEVRAQIITPALKSRAKTSSFAPETQAPMGYLRAVAAD